MSDVVEELEAMIEDNASLKRDAKENGDEQIVAHYEGKLAGLLRAKLLLEETGVDTEAAEMDGVTVTAAREDWETLDGFVDHVLFHEEDVHPDEDVESIDRICSRIWDALPDDEDGDDDE